MEPGHPIWKSLVWCSATNYMTVMCNIVLCIALYYCPVQCWMLYNSTVLCGAIYYRIAHFLTIYYSTALFFRRYYSNAHFFTIYYNTAHFFTKYYHCHYHKSVYNGFAIAIDCTLIVVLFGFCSLQVMPVFRISFWLLRRSDTNFACNGSVTVLHPFSQCITVLHTFSQDITVERNIKQNIKEYFSVTTG